MSISAHKLGGPKGVGALVIRDGVDLPAFIVGGGQERRRRAGTENVAAIAGFGAAAAAATAGLADMARVRDLRDRLESEMLRDHARCCRHRRGRRSGCRIRRASALAGHEAATLLIKLDLAGVAVSAGSACSSGKIGGSHVLAAMGIEPRWRRPRSASASGRRAQIATSTRFVVGVDGHSCEHARQSRCRELALPAAAARRGNEMRAGD